jgi:hypothetical protein
MKEYDPKNQLGDLEEKLNSRSLPYELNDQRSRLSQIEVDVDQTWQGEKESDIKDLLAMEHDREGRDTNKFYKKILIFSSLFFIFAVGIALFVFFGGKNFVSANKIDVEVVGPSFTSGGEVLTVDVVVKNKNRVSLQNVWLTLEYPDGTRSPGDLTVDLKRSRVSIGSVPAHDETRKTISAVLFGEKDSIKVIKMGVEYELEGSSAVYTKEKIYEVLIKSSPVIVSISGPKEINSGQEFDFVVDLSSNSPDVLKGVLFKAEYPYGFVFKGSDPVAAVDNKVWKIGDLSPGDKRRIVIRGTLQGQNDEERTFRFATGIADPLDDEKLSPVFSNIASSIKIERPFVAIELYFGSVPGDAVTSPGQRMTGTIEWTNNLPSELIDASIVLTFPSDSVLDKSSVGTSGGGFYRSIDNTIVWDKFSHSFPSTLLPGKSGAVNFSFSTQKNIPPTSGSKQIPITINVTGNQVIDTGKQEKISTVIERVVKVGTRLTFGSRSVRSQGSFENRGPIPPQVEVETTYNIIWSVSNSFNTVSNAVAIAKLPSYVKWENLVAPANESVVYNPESRELRWNMGDIAAGTGFSSPTRDIYFQVSIVPSVSQVSTAPVLVHAGKITGTDRFTGKEVTEVSSEATTRFTTDPTYTRGDDTVAN